MAADCENTRAQMLELLHDELGTEARAELDAHVAGCAGCKAELAALQSTRALVRERLATDSPPPRARAAILQAAAAAVPARKAPAKPAAPSFWTRIRAKWTLPTFATVGALAVFLLASRIFMEPEKTYERGRQGLAPAAAPAEAPADVPREERLAEKPAAAEPKPVAASAPPPIDGVAPGRAAHHKHAKAGSSGTEYKNREPSLDGLLAAPAPAAKSREFAPAPKSAAKGSIADDDLLDGFAERPLAKQKSAGGAGLVSKPAAGEPAPAPPPARAAAPRAEAEESADEDQASRPARETPVQRADRLFTQRRWVEAAVAYRELLRDQPRSPDVPRWRLRLTACEAAISGQH